MGSLKVRVNGEWFYVPTVGPPAKSLVGSHVGTAGGAETTSATYVACAGFPMPDVTLRAGHTYKMTATLMVQPNSGQFVQGVIRCLRSGSDTSEGGVTTAVVTLTVVRLYTVPSDQAVSIEVGYGVYFGGGTADHRRDVVLPRLIVEDLG
jgi:hypothetical protein